MSAHWAPVVEPGIVGTTEPATDSYHLRVRLPLELLDQLHRRGWAGTDRMYEILAPPIPDFIINFCVKRRLRSE